MAPRTIACLAPLSMGFSRQEYWSGLPFPSPGSSRPRGQTWVSCIAGGCVTIWASRKAPWLPKTLPVSSCFFFFGGGQVLGMSGGILVPPPGNEPVPPTSGSTALTTRLLGRSLCLHRVSLLWWYFLGLGSTWIIHLKTLTYTCKDLFPNKIIHRSYKGGSIWIFFSLTSWAVF